MLLPLAVLLGLLCWRVWGLGVTHTDDAWWLLRSYGSAQQTVADWAGQQGRLWAYISGTLIMHALSWQGTLYGEVLRLGSFVLFFVLFHVAAAQYCGRRIALLAASLFLALFALRWDGSILHTYPLITWPAVSACALALLAGRSYTRPSGRTWHLAAALLLQFAALFNNEGVTVACIALSLLAALANRAPGGDPVRSRRLLIGFLAVGAAYAVVYVGWRVTHPSSYAGNTLAPFDARMIATTLLHFSTSGTVLHSLFSPFTLAYTEPLQSGAWITWDMQTGLLAGLESPPALLAGVLSGWLVWRQLGGNPGAGAVRARAAILGGVALAILPIAPVALVSTYQNWVAEMSVRAYSHTVLAWFGWSLALAGACDLLARVAVARRVVAAVLAASVALLAVAGAQVNDRIAGMMRNEAGRWQMLDRAVELNRTLLASRAVWMPGLASRTQYGGLVYPYWDQYVRHRFGGQVVVSETIPEINEVAAGVTVYDYAWDAQGRRLVALAMVLRRPPGGVWQPGRVAVDLGGGDPRDYVLAYRAGGRAVRAALAARPGRTMFSVDVPPSAEPDSVRLLRADADTPALCAVRLPDGVRIDLRLSGGRNPALDLKDLLVEGWNPVEPDWTWTRGGRVVLRIPAALIPAGTVALGLDTESYTSAGYHPGVQRMRAALNGVPAGQWEYPHASPPPAVRMLLPPRAAGADLVLEMQVEPGMAPRQLGVSDEDGRELGIRVKQLMLLAK